MIHKGQGLFVTRIMGKLQKALPARSGVIRFLLANAPLLALAVVVILFGAFAEWQSPQWRYQREAVLAGEAWRLLSGHFMHLGFSHLLLNLSGLGLVMLLFGRGVSAAGWIWLLLASLLALGAGFVWLSPELGWYVGLSGVLHGLILGGAVLDRDFPCRERNILLGIVIFKLLWEQHYGALPFTAEAAGGAVVVVAHWYGGIGGLVGAILYRGVTRFLNSRASRV